MAHRRFSPLFAAASKDYFPVVDGGRLGFDTAGNARYDEKIRELTPEEYGEPIVREAGWKVFIDYGISLLVQFEPTDAELLGILFDIEPHQDAFMCNVIASAHDQFVWLHLRQLRLSADDVERYLRRLLDDLISKGIIQTKP